MCQAGDEVLSDVHLFRQPTDVSSYATKTVWRTEFPFSDVPYTDLNAEKEAGSRHAFTFDEDGDIVVARKQQHKSSDAVKAVTIEHNMATPVQDVGLQVWHGALLMCDFIMSNQELFSDSTVMELGAGLGLTSIVIATVAKTILCTDVGSDVLHMCKKNIETNKHLYGDSKIIVKEFDWRQETLRTDKECPFYWSVEDLNTLENDVSIILAADVIYDDDLTDAFFRSVYNVMSHGRQKTLYIALEKRYNFTLAELSVTCSAYDHFQECLEFLQTLRSDRNGDFIVTKLPTTFPQYFQYHRIKEMELWVITTEKR
ncbi:methyltransferase-like protein 22 [Ptychodera flava]|uniref:methyltransferase-like protein 22 n=1 Tax=Ptychodera flava TaxID=63121 RepID=UPI003969FFC7